LAIPGGFQVNKEIAMSSGQLSQVRNSLNTTLVTFVIMLSGKYSSSNLFWKNGVGLTSKFQ